MHKFGHKTKVFYNSATVGGAIAYTRAVVALDLSGTVLQTLRRCHMAMTTVRSVRFDPFPLLLPCQRQAEGVGRGKSLMAGRHGRYNRGHLGTNIAFLQSRVGCDLYFPARYKTRLQ